MKRLLFALFVVFMTTSLFIGALPAQPAKAQGTIYVDADAAGLTMVLHGQMPSKTFRTH